MQKGTGLSPQIDPSISPWAFAPEGMLSQADPLPEEQAPFFRSASPLSTPAASL